MELVEQALWRKRYAARRVGELAGRCFSVGSEATVDLFGGVQTRQQIGNHRGQVQSGSDRKRGVGILVARGIFAYSLTCPGFVDWSERHFADHHESRYETASGPKSLLVTVLLSLG